MVTSIFKKLDPSTAEALRSQEVRALDAVNVDEITNALKAVKGELEIAHSSLQKLFEEAHYVYTRLEHMEQTMLAKSKGAKETEDEGEDGGSTGSGDVVIEKVLSGFTEGKSEARLAKILKAKSLTQELLTSIESLSEKISKTKTFDHTPSTPGMKF